MPRNEVDYFERTFNRLVANRKGERYKAARASKRPSRPGRRNYADPTRLVMGSIGSGAVRLKGDARKRYEAAFGPATERRTVTDSFIDAVTNAQVEMDTLSERNEFVRREFERLVSNDDNFQNSIAGRTLDIINRPFYAINEGLRAARQASNEGQTGFWDTFDEALGGLREGITGRAKTGFGEYVEEYSKGDNLVGRALQELEEEHPEISKWTKRGLGFAGELLLDPLNMISGGSVAVARQGGRKLTTEAVQDYAERAARAAGREAFEGSALKALPVPGVGVDSKATSRFMAGQDAVGEIAGGAARTATERAALEVRGGPNRGKLKLGRGTFAPTVANASAEAVRSSVLNSFEKKFTQFMRHFNSPDEVLTPVQVRKFISSDPNFKKFWEAIPGVFNATRPSNPLTDMDAIIRALKGMTPEHQLNVFRAAAQTVRDGVDGQVAKVHDSVAKQLTDFYYNAPSIRLVGKDIPIRPIGRAYTKVAQTIQKGSRFPEDTLSAVSYARQFPGRLSSLGQRTRSRGVLDYETFAKEMRKVARRFSYADGRRLQRAIEDGIEMADPALEEARQFLMTKYQEMFNEQIATGARNATDPTADSFAYVFNRGGTRKKRTEFKESRKAAVRERGSTKGYQTEDAKKAGLRPIDNAFEAILYYRMKHIRDMSKAWFLRDLIDHYGLITTKISKAAVAKRNLSRIPDNKIAADIKEAMGREGAAVYLPKEMRDIYDRWSELTRISNDDLGVIRRNLQKITNKYKTIVTLPLPGFHIRNMTFDYMMGLMDGVPTRAYMEVLTKWSRKGNTSFAIAPGITLTWDQAWDLFRRNASSGGFYSIDIGPRTGIRRFAGIPGKTRELAEFREDFGRFVHFLHALRDETRGLGKKAGTVPDRAIEAAVYRVNHYKFDYGALTALERQNLKLAFPFYTFARKSIPMMIEAMFTSPRLLARTHRFMEGEGQADQNFNDMLVPAWMREIGYAQLTDEKEPWVIGGDVMPTSPLNTIDWPFNTSPTDPNTTDFFQSILSQVNPLVNIPYENVAQEKIFSGQPIESFSEQLIDLLAPYGAIESMTDSDRSFVEQLLSNRLFTGMSTRKISEEQQQYAERELEDRVIDDPFREFNYSQDELRIYKTRAGVFRVKDIATDRVIFESRDPVEALRFAQDQ